MGFLTLEEIEDNFIDDRNRDLWNKLASRYTIGVNDDYSYYKLDYAKEDDVVYILTDKSYNRNLFTHELLHLYLRYIGIDTVKMVKEKLIILGSDPLQNFKSQVIYNLLNNIEHILFINEYRGLGFLEEEFIADYYTSTYNDALFGQLIHFKSDPFLSSFYKTLFLSMAVTMLLEKEININRDNFLQRMYEIDPYIYMEAELFFNQINGLNFSNVENSKSIIYDMIERNVNHLD